MTSQCSKMTPSSFFWRCFASLVKFSYWFKFHINIINSSGVMAISFYKVLARNPENGNTNSKFCPISAGWGELGISNLARTSLIKCYWLLQNARVTTFTVSALLTENQQGESKITTRQTKIRIRTGSHDIAHDENAMSSLSIQSIGSGRKHSPVFYKNNFT